jgi:hypothetical protein
MTDQERNQVLKMIEDGRISPEEGLKLMQALDQSSAEAEIVPAPATAEAAAPDVQWKAESSGMEVDPRITSIKEAVQRLWQIPMWIGVAITIASAIGMFLIMRGPGLNFWFYFMVFPLLLGVLIMVLAVGSHKARWLFVDIEEKAGSDGHPRRIFFGFPLPLRFIAWVMRTFRHWIPNLDRELHGASIDEIINVVESGTAGTPFIVNVDEGKGGDRVRVFIG